MFVAQLQPALQVLQELLPVLPVPLVRVRQELPVLVLVPLERELVPLERELVPLEREPEREPPPLHMPLIAMRVPQWHPILP